VREEGARRRVLAERSLRSCLARFATGVAVVTFDSPGGRRGITVNSFTSVSLEPPLVLVSVAKRASAHDALSGRPFCVNVLGAEQEALARTFASGPQTGVQWVEGEHAPRLPGVLANLECTPWREYDGGDHTLYLGEVQGFEYRDGAALGYLSSSFQTIAEQELGVEYLI
jgi:flavin reductase (DIM6/NTAB) family NADH-FMN oxidoreductase RutF